MSDWPATGARHSAYPAAHLRQSLSRAPRGSLPSPAHARQKEAAPVAAPLLRPCRKVCTSPPAFRSENEALRSAPSLPHSAETGPADEIASHSTWKHLTHSPEPVQSLLRASASSRSPLQAAFVPRASARNTSRVDCSLTCPIWP